MGEPVKIYRDVPNGITWIERGAGGPLVALPDHGDPEFRWTIPSPDLIVYDDELHAVEHDHLDDARDRLITAVGGSDLPPTVKSRVRQLVTDTMK